MANGYGGSRPNAGRPKKALADAIIDGTRPSRLKAVKFSGEELLTDTTPTVPETMGYLKESQKDGDILLAEQFFASIWGWLVERKCENLFEINYLQRFAMQQARYVQLERLISRHGFLAKSASGDARDNPLEAMLMNRLKVLNQMQYTIENTVRANCTTPYTGFVNSDDPMEALLNGKR
ncbi:MAG: hypothetical protein ACYCYM_14270 [Saccharofermentanales bacterium]